MAVPRFVIEWAGVKVLTSIRSPKAEMVALHMQSIRDYFLVGMISTVLFLASGCDSDDGSSLISEKSWDVSGLPDTKVVERIVKTGGWDWPDPEFKRTYWLIQGKAKSLIGSYTNESSVGIVKEPYAVGECIVIPTSCYFYLVDADNQTKTFYPFQADQWSEFAEPLGINGHYDYLADAVDKIDGGWRLSYLLKSGLNGKRPPSIRFVTRDDWKSFQIETVVPSLKSREQKR